MVTDISTILGLKVPVIVQIGRRRLSMDDVLALGPGAILELDKKADGDLDLLVNNKIIGEGAAVKVGENFGVRISSMGMRIVYFYGAMVPKHVLAAFITFADSPFYPTYERVRLILPGTPLEDQQLASHIAALTAGQQRAAQRQAATVAQATIATQVHQALDRHADFAAQVALDHELADFGAQALDFRLGQVADLGGRRHAGGVADELGTGTADAVDALQPDPDVLLGRQVDTCNTRHARISNWLVGRKGLLPAE